MTAKWPTRPLRELTVNHDEKRRPVKESDRKPGPYPYYGASGVVDYVDDYLIDGEYLLIAEDGENLRTRKTPIAFMARGKSWVNNHAHIVTGNTEADTEYLMYALAVMDISGYLTGAVMPKLSQANLNRVEVPCPPLSVQRKIVSKLKALDDKIELNRRMNQTLEAIARALFKSWFVDFDPVRAKAEGRDTGLPKDIAALFPGRFVNSELGEIPEGWSVSPLNAVADLVAKSIKPAHGKEWQHYSIPAFDANRWPSTDMGESIKSNKYLVPPNTVLISKLNPQFPRVWAPDPIDQDAAICSTEFMPFVPKEMDNRPFLYLLANSPNFQSEIENRATGSTGSRQRVKPKDVEEMLIIFPGIELAGTFASQVRQFLEKQNHSLVENRHLSNIRNLLLPDLLSGKFAL